MISKPIFILSLLLVLLPTTSFATTTITVGPSGCDYKTIQNAIDAASLGDVIEVHSGFYEHAQYPLDTER